MRILLIDDEESFLKQYTRALQGAFNCEIVTADTLEKACDELTGAQRRGEAFDAIVTDQNYPEGEHPPFDRDGHAAGVALLKQIKINGFGGNKDIPVVLQSTGLSSGMKRMVEERYGNTVRAIPKAPGDTLVAALKEMGVGQEKPPQILGPSGSL